MFTRASRLWLPALAAILMVGSAQAGLIPAAVNVTAESGHFRFTYSVLLPSDYQLKPGDFFTIYDFNGLLGANSQPAGWSYSSSLSGPNPPLILPNDDPGVANITWTYTGAAVTGPQNLGDFSALSLYGLQETTEFSSQDHLVLTGRAVGNITTTFGPAEDRVSETPEPATFLLLGASLPAVGLWGLIRRRLA